MKSSNIYSKINRINKIIFLFDNKNKNMYMEYKEMSTITTTSVKYSKDGFLVAYKDGSTVIAPQNISFANQKFSLDKGLNVSAGATTLGDTLTVAAGKATTLNGTLSVVGDNATALGGSLTVTGGTTLSGAVTAGSTLLVTGGTTLTGAVAASSSLAVAGGTTLTGAVTAGSTLLVTGGTTLTGAVIASSSLAVTGAVTASSTLAVTGATTLTGAASAGSTLNVSGATTLSSSLVVSGTTTLNDNLTVVGDKATALGGSLVVTGGTTLTGAVAASSTLAVTGGTTLTGAVTASSTLAVTGGTTLTGAVTAGSTLVVTGGTTLTGAVTASNTLGVAGNVSITSSTDPALSTDAAALKVTGGLVAGGKAHLGSTLAVTGAATFGTDVTISGKLTVTGSTTTLNTTILEVKDPAILMGYGNDGDLKAMGIDMVYKSGGANKYAGMKRIPNTGEIVFFKNAGSTIESASNDLTDTSITYADVQAESFNSASDIRLKKDVVELDGALDKIDSIRGVHYHWINEEQSKERQVGVIAQEIQAVYPELVMEGGNGFLSVDYPKLTAVLIQSIKELKAMVLALANK
jgi:predicted acyltransferase (DUF342 family)